MTEIKLNSQNILHLLNASNIEKNPEMEIILRNFKDEITVNFDDSNKTPYFRELYKSRLSWLVEINKTVEGLSIFVKNLIYLEDEANIDVKTIEGYSFWFAYHHKILSIIGVINTPKPI